MLLHPTSLFVYEIHWWTSFLPSTCYFVTTKGNGTCHMVLLTKLPSLDFDILKDKVASTHVWVLEINKFEIFMWEWIFLNNSNGYAFSFEKQFFKKRNFNFFILKNQNFQPTSPLPPPSQTPKTCAFLVHFASFHWLNGTYIPTFVCHHYQFTIMAWRYNYIRFKMYFLYHILLRWNKRKFILDFFSKFYSCIVNKHTKFQIIWKKRCLNFIVYLTTFFFPLPKIIIWWYDL